MSLFPLVRFDPIELEQANACLREWGHKMGPCLRPNADVRAHGLFHGEQLVSVAITSALVREHVGGGLQHLCRSNTLELSRLCAERPGLCRVTLRLWREFVFPGLRVPVCISYQDADLHNGNTYRFDGWERVGYSESGSADQRSGRAGRNKWIWAWPPLAAAALKEAA